MMLLAGASGAVQRPASAADSIPAAPADSASAVPDTLRPPPAVPRQMRPVPAPSPLDTAGVGLEWSSERIKKMLERETGEPDIEGTSWQKRKNPRTAMLCALAVPGLGQIYNEKPLKAAIAMGVEMFYLLQIMDNSRKERREADLRDQYPKYVPCGLEGQDLCIDPDWRYHNAWMEEYKARKIDWVWWTAASVLVIMLDAYVDAHLHDMTFRLEPASVPGGGGLAAVVEF
jgi:hypothetical protein